ncbi:hypothetical protein [Algoriphagus sp. CAU 1675]|uniref:hypothetical protein n=1 Tax=Algoriphagus sp. CAU 1675 TaxID=3032597 RepID=UPI0023DBC7A2|nr:hypothetical protein [Algoriphagus sp. CAU 1675]MDF2157414.1 hypothetical protein [Algoriphagus sp. CAU 1675]
MTRIKFYTIQAISVFLGFTFFGAGMAKLFADHQYFGWIGPVWLIERLQEYGLGFFAEFIAYSQLFIGFMLMTTRYKLLGSIMLVPLILNTLMVTISLNWRGTPFVLGFLLVLNLVLLFQYRDFFIPLLNEGKVGGHLKIRVSRSLLGHGVWLSGFCLEILSIPLSSQSWEWAIILSFLGIILGILSFKMDGNTRKNYGNLK